MPASAPACSEPATQMARPEHRGGHREHRVTMQRLAEEEARQQRGDERRGAEHDQHVGDRRQAEREDEGDEAAGKQHGAGEQRERRHCARRSARRGAARSAAATLRQPGTPIARTTRPMPAESMWRTITPAVLKIVAAPTAQATPTARRNSRGSGARFHGKETVNTDSTCPRPSIPSTCRRSGHAFRGGRRSADARRAARQPISPTCRRIPASASAFRMADRTGDILLGMLDRPADAASGASAGHPGARPDRLRGQLPCPERGAASARSRLSRAAAERARRRRLARIAASTITSAAPRTSAACCRNCPTS